MNLIVFRLPYPIDVPPDSNSALLEASIPAERQTTEPMGCTLDELLFN